MSGTFMLLDFSAWYYTRAFRDIFAVWFNFMWFIVHFFSIPLLLRTLFAPWKRITDESRPKGVEDFLASHLMNGMSRVLGALVRVTVIACGVLFLLLGTLGLFLFVALWVCLPVLSVAALLYGIVLLTL
jgi:hypothetical protein